jgi:hypothetical protein
MRLLKFLELLKPIPLPCSPVEAQAPSLIVLGGRGHIHFCGKASRMNGKA